MQPQSKLVLIWGVVDLCCQSNESYLLAGGGGKIDCLIEWSTFDQVSLYCCCWDLFIDTKWIGGKQTQL